MWQSQRKVQKIPPKHRPNFCRRSCRKSDTNICKFARKNYEHYHEKFAMRFIPSLTPKTRQLQTHLIPQGSENYQKGFLTSEIIAFFVSQSFESFSHSILEINPASARSSKSLIENGGLHATDSHAAGAKVEALSNVHLRQELRLWHELLSANDRLHGRQAISAKIELTRASEKTNGTTRAALVRQSSFMAGQKGGTLHKR